MIIRIEFIDEDGAISKFERDAHFVPRIGETFIGTDDHAAHCQGTVENVEHLYDTKTGIVRVTVREG
ncbi:MAG TPA: hypothetical protein VF503_20330 [Sphingobium sp.]|uniref:hypothetical protein n=1 Tax=Sphingobium sp. TaxID=1912891 RepID=UPI002ED0C5FB